MRNTGHDPRSRREGGADFVPIGRAAQWESSVTGTGIMPRPSLAGCSQQVALASRLAVLPPHAHRPDSARRKSLVLVNSFQGEIVQQHGRTALDKIDLNHEAPTGGAPE